MNRGFSLYLDVLRSLAAIVVVISHIGYARFTEGRWLWVRDLNLGSDAVVIFFVLSGLVIAFTAETKDHRIGIFAFHRLTRIMSVALPALVVGFALDRIGAQLFPAFYALGWYNALPLGEQLLRGLTFSNEWGGFATRLGTNGPYWSLSYEVAYYALFAVVFYLRGPARIVLAVAALVVFGLNILLLAPCWLVGVLVWRCLKNMTALRRDTARALMIGPALFYVAALMIDLPEILTAVTYTQLGPLNLRFSDEFLWNAVLAVGVGIHLIGAAHLFQNARNNRRSAVIRWCAGGSFSLYLIHYPLLQFLKPGLPQTGLPLFDDLVLFTATVLGCLAFAQVFERTIGAQRQALRQMAKSLAVPRPI